MSTSTNFELFNHFHNWVDDNQVAGTDGLGNEAKYIPFEALVQYWQDDRVYPILKSCSHYTSINVSIDDLLKRYLRIFSILVYISKTHSAKLHYIKKFMEKATIDNFLPFKAKPEALPNAIDGVETFAEFEENQWLFSPVVLGPDRLQSMDLLRRTVLPFTVEKVLSGKHGESSIVKKCNVHPSGGLPVSTIVLKEFDSSEIEFSFNTEVDSYTSLENKVPPKLYPHHFLKYYGSFKKADKAFIMLEFADQGSLLDFFNGNQLPYERHEIHGLWSSLSNLFIGLEHIHSLDPDHKNSDLGTIRCVHQDLKPANIFVFRQGDSTTYRYQFKIGDFGMTSIALVKTTSKSTRIPADPSTKMYGAPELTNTHSALDTIEYGTLWEVDIWSMGCVLFEALVWMTCGSRGVSEFFQMRQKETDSDLRHESQGYSGCFHNGTARIRAVDDMMDLVMERRRNFDDLSEPIGDLILREMLIPSDKRRLEPRTLLPRFEKILEAEKRPPDHPETFEAHSWTPTTQRGSRSQDRTNHRGNKGSQAYDPARAYTTSPGTRRYDSPRPISTNIRASTSFTDSRNTFPPSIEARPMHAEPVSVIPIQSFDREHSRQSMILSDGPHLISQSPDNSKFLQDTSNPAVKDLEQTFAERSNHDHQHREGLTPSNDRPRLGNSSPSALAVASGSKVKGPEPYALVTISEVLKWIEKKKSGPAPEALRDQERAMREIKDREQIFVVDDSDTMRDQHWDRVVDVLQALGYLVKSADPDGVELFLTSRPTEPKKSGGREITSLVRSLEDHRKTPHVGICNMENSLGPILEHVKSSLKSQKRPKILQRNRRGTNVYILTDAIWEGGADVKCGVEEPIKNLRKAMIDMSKTRATVSLQFIQFGDDPLGKERLRYLDDTLGKELNFDIVDHRHCQRDGVWHMLVGSISRDLDKDNNVESQAAVT